MQVHAQTVAKGPATCFLVGDPPPFRQTRALATNHACHKSPSAVALLCTVRLPTTGNAKQRKSKRIEQRKNQIPALASCIVGEVGTFIIDG